ncbi:hypothetical protein INR49_028665 [Caranx melampygus]|nr:hypothetical protein INR49_028665 [Caranx melampygus]
MSGPVSSISALSVCPSALLRLLRALRLRMDAAVRKKNPVGLEGNSKTVWDRLVNTELGGGEKTPIRTPADVLACQPCFSTHRRG